MCKSLCLVDDGSTIYILITETCCFVCLFRPWCFAIERYQQFVIELGQQAFTRFLPVEASTRLPIPELSFSAQIAVKMIQFCRQGNFFSLAFVIIVIIVFNESILKQFWLLEYQLKLSVLVYAWWRRWSDHIQAISNHISFYRFDELLRKSFELFIDLNGFEFNHQVLVELDKQSVALSKHFLNHPSMIPFRW